MSMGKSLKLLGRWRDLCPSRPPREEKNTLCGYSGIGRVAPIWTNSLNVDARRLFHRWQRAIAVRICSVYRSVSFDSATLLARLIPYEQLAAERARIFRRIQDAKEAGLVLTNVIGDVRVQESVLTQRQWMMLASRPGASGVRLRDALLSHLPAWMNRR